MASEKLIYAMLLDDRYYDIYNNKLGYLLEKIERDAVAMIGAYLKKYGDISVSGFIDYIIKYPEISDYINYILSQNNEDIVAENEFYDILNTLIKCVEKEEIKKIKVAIKNENDINKKIELITKLTELKKGCGNNEGN